MSESSVHGVLREFPSSPNRPQDGAHAEQRENSAPLLLAEMTGDAQSGGKSYPTVSDGDTYNDLPTFPERPHFHEHHWGMRPETQIVAFSANVLDKGDPRPAAIPLYQTATFCQPSADEFGEYDYTRSGNPTRTALETLVAGLEGAHSAFAFTSGMAALSCVTRLIGSAEQVVASADLYGGMHRLLTRVRSPETVSFVDSSDVAAVRECFEQRSGTTGAVKLLHIESPSNPLMKISDIRALSALCVEFGVVLSVDATMMSPHLMKALDLGADIVIHSATKFLSGHSDTMGGVVCVKTPEMAQRVAFLQNAEGTALAPFDCWLLLRSIKTMAIRVERAQENAVAVASFLSRHPAVSRLHYAGPIPNPRKERYVTWERNKWLVGHQAFSDGANTAAADERLEIKKVNVSMSHAAHRLHLSQARGGGSVISFETGSVEFSKRVVNALRLFKITVSFGSCNSLVELPCLLSHASIPSEKRTLPEDLIRISIGIEAVDDILQDLERAFKCAASDVEDVRSINQSYSELQDIPLKDLIQGAGDGLV